MTPLRTAIIGYGLAGRVFHGPLLNHEPRCVVTAVVTRDSERAGQAAAAHPDAKIVPTLSALLDANLGIDLAVVAAPTPLHAEIATSTLEAGIATVVDKPLAVHASDAEKLIELAEKKQTHVIPFQNRRWDGDFLTVKRLLEHDALGSVHRFSSSFEWLNPRPRPQWKSGTAGRDGGGVAYDLGAHLIDQATQLFGRVSEHWGELETRRRGSPNDDDSFIVLRHENGVISHLAMSSIVAQPGPRFRVLGEDSAFTKWTLDPQEAQLASGMSPTDPVYGTEGQDHFGRLGKAGQLSAVPTERGNYPVFYRTVADTLLNGAPPPVEPHESLETIRILESLHASSH